MTIRRSCSIIIVALAGIVVPASATIVVTGTYTGTPAPTVTSPSNFGVYGKFGYVAMPSADTYLVTGATVTGGAGGSVIGNDPPGSLASSLYGGDGAPGLEVESPNSVPTIATIASGTFTGGAGGNTAGPAHRLTPGGGGLGFYGIHSTLTILNGNFVGGAAGVATGSADVVQNDIGGEAARFDYSTVDIYGGTFSVGAAGPGQAGLVADIVNMASTVTFYGSGFTVNGAAAQYGSNYTGNYSAVTITGLLANNAAATTLRYSGGSVNFQPAPEPTALALMGGAGATVLAQRRARLTRAKGAVSDSRERRGQR